MLNGLPVRPTKTIWLILLGSVTLPLFARFAWVAGKAETGWETVAVSWRDATVGGVGLVKHGFDAQDPSEHVRFWQEHIKPVLDRHPRDADKHMAAAWLFESPTWGLHAGFTDLPGFCDEVRPTFSDGESRWAFLEQFNSEASPICLELAARATELEPENRENWRQRALLLSDPYRGKSESRDRLTALEKAISHDPDNALYDYAAAVLLWDASARWDYDGTGMVVVVEDAEMFADGKKWFERGLRKKFFVGPCDGNAAIADFLDGTSLSRVEATNASLTRSIHDGPMWLLHRLVRWTGGLAETINRAGDPRGALEMLNQRLKMLDRANIAEVPLSWRWLANLHRAGILYDMQGLAGEHLELMSAEQMTSLHKEELRCRVDTETWLEARQRLAASQKTGSAFDVAFPTLVMLYAQSLLAGLMICAVLVGGLARVCCRAESDPSELGPIRHALIWISSFGIAFLFLGAFPSEMIDHDVQRVVIVVLAWLLGGGLMIVLGRRLLRLCRCFTPDAKRLPVFSVAIAISGWQFVLAFLLTLTGSAFSFSCSDVVLALAGLPVPILLFAILTPVLVCGFVADLIRRQRRLGRRLGREYFATGLLLLVSTVLVVAAFLLKPGFAGRFDGLPALAPDVAFAGYWKTALEVEDGSWQWAIAQWTVYRGHYVAPLLGVSLAIGWYAWRRRRRAYGDMPSRSLWRTRAFYGGLLRCARRSAVMLAVCALLVYFAVAPHTSDALNTSIRPTCPRRESMESTGQKSAGSDRR